MNDRDEEQVLAVAHAWDRAMIGNDPESIGQLTSEDIRVRLYGDAAVVTARGVSGGRYQSQPFREVERSSSVFVRQQGEWRCVLTHLSRLASA